MEESPGWRLETLGMTEKPHEEQYKSKTGQKKAEAGQKQLLSGEKTTLAGWKTLPDRRSSSLNRINTKLDHKG